MIKRKTTVVTQEEVEDIICNVCAESLSTDYGTYEGVRNVWSRFGYGAKYFDDMDLVRFDICEKCLFEYIKTWKIDPITKWDSSD